MTVSTDFSFVPLVGLNTLVQVADSISAPLGDLYPYFWVSIGSADPDVVPLNVAGDGDTPSRLVTGGTGRDGNMKFIAIVQGQFFGGEAGNTFHFDIAMNVPTLMQGVDNFTQAEALDTSGYPLLDPSRFLPKVDMQPYYSPYAPFAGDSPTDATAWAATIAYTAGINPNNTVSGYISQTSWGEITANTLNTDNIGQFGFVVSRFSVSIPGAFSNALALMLSIDFSHTATN